jgi:peptide/nickel transport system permease protein
MPIVLLLVVTLVFLTHMVPGSAVRVLLGPHAGVAQLEKATAEYGLDKPLLTQYFLYMGHLFQGDLGRSIVTRRTVASELMTFLPATLELTLYSLILIIVVGIVLGVVAAVHRNSVFDVMARGGRRGCCRNSGLGSGLSSCSPSTCDGSRWAGA